MERKTVFTIAGAVVLGAGAIVGYRAWQDRSVDNNALNSSSPSTTMSEAILNSVTASANTPSSISSEAVPIRTEVRTWNGSSYTITIYPDGTECANIDSFAETGNHVDGAVQVLSHISQYIEVRGTDGQIIDQFNRVSGSNPQSSNVPVDADACVVK